MEEEKDIFELIQEADEEYAESIRNMETGDENYNIEWNHHDADHILLKIVRAFGFHKTADAFEELPKRYA